MTKDDKRIEQLTTKIAELGPMLPGSISEQWNVCGTPRCHCKDPENPVKHGPYYQLSFTVGGKSSTLFIKKDDLSEARRCIERYRQFKVLTAELVHAHIAMVRKSGFNKRRS